MRSLVLVPWSETAWSASGRIVSRMPVPLTEAGRKQSEAWGRSMAPLEIGVLYSGNEQSAGEAARLIAEKCGARHKVEATLAEVDAGLWTGLTYEELKRRDPKVFKRWFEDPTSVCPPEGEDLSDAATRLKNSLKQLVRKKGGRNMAVLLGPVAFGVSRCVIEDVDLEELRSMMGDEPLRYDLKDDGEFDAPAQPECAIGNDVSTEVESGEYQGGR